MNDFGFWILDFGFTALLVVLFVGLAVAQPARAQVEPPVEPPVRESEEVNLIFEQGLEAYAEGFYGMAYRRFRLIWRDYPLTTKTTAALLMAGRARYRAGDYEGAVAVLQQLLEGYPTSGYLDEAQRVLDFAQMQLAREGQEQRVLQLGIVLPLSGDDAYLTQAMFNGLRLAVAEHNARSARPVRMLFRDTGRSPEQARRAVAELGRLGADGIVGPLYSNAAEAAGGAAEVAEVVLVAPLATEEDVSGGRRYVFQTNPTITRRGRIMAEFAMEELGLDDLGVIAQFGNSLSERMAEGFQQEVRRRGGQLRFFALLEGAEAWAALVERLGEEPLTEVRGVYVPVAGGSAPQIIRTALAGLSEIGTGARLLGNSEWHNRPMAEQASRYLTTYTNDFYVDPADPDVQAFIQSYRALTGETPDGSTVTAERLAYTGYDVAVFLLGALDAAEEDAPAREALREAPLYEGLGMRIDFREGNVNDAMFFFRYYDGRIERVR